MTYLILGENEESKREHIADLKKKFLPGADAQNFDCRIFYGSKLDTQTLQKAFLDLPAVGPKRLIIIHTIHQLTARNKDVVFEFVSAPHDHAVLVLESSQSTSQDGFVKKLMPFVRLSEFSAGVKANVFDMTRAIGGRRCAEALKILENLLSEGTHPLQIMGGLVWFWGKTGRQLSGPKYEEGLLALQEADLDIKRSRLKPDYAVERLVVRLCTILD